MTFVEPGTLRKFNARQAKKDFEAYKKRKLQKSLTPGFIHPVEIQGPKGLGTLPREILQKIFIKSHNFDLVLCDCSLHEKLIGSEGLHRRILEEFVDENDRIPYFLIERRFVTRTLLEQLRIKDLIIDHDHVFDLDHITYRKFEIFLYFWSLGSKVISVSTLILAAVKRNDYQTVIDIFNSVEKDLNNDLQGLNDRSLHYQALISSFENDNPDMARLLLSKKLIDLTDINIWNYIKENKAWQYYNILIEFGASPPLSLIV